MASFASPAWRIIAGCGVAALPSRITQLSRGCALKHATGAKRNAVSATAESIRAAECEVKYRWHDLRHTFITRLAENPNVSEQTIKALAGHVSKQMLERYSHIRTQAKQDAIAALHFQRLQVEDRDGKALHRAQ